MTPITERDRKEEKTIHPLLEDIYGMVGAAYQLGTWPDKPVLGADAAHAESVKDDVASKDISNLMAMFTAVLNQVNDRLTVALAQAREGRISEDDKKMAEEALADGEQQYHEACSVHQPESDKLGYVIRSVAQALATVRADEKAKYEKELLAEKQKRVDGYNLGVDDGKAEARMEEMNGNQKAQAQCFNSGIQEALAAFDKRRNET
jgi:hypothetical protein